MVKLPAWGFLVLLLSATPAWAQGSDDLLDLFSDLSRAESDVPFPVTPPVDDDPRATGLARLKGITQTLEWLDKKDANLLEETDARCAKADQYFNDARALLARMDRVPGLVGKLEGKLSKQGPVRPEFFHGMAAEAEDIWHGVELDELVIEEAYDAIEVKADKACDEADAVKAGVTGAQGDLTRARAAAAALVDERQKAANVLTRLGGDINRVRELQADLHGSHSKPSITSDPNYREVAETAHKARFGQAHLQGIALGLSQKLAEHAAIYQEAKQLEADSHRLSLDPSEANERKVLSDRIAASWEGIGLRVGGPWSDLYYCGQKTDDLSNRFDEKWSTTRDRWVALLGLVKAAMPTQDIEAARKQVDAVVAKADKVVDAVRKMANKVAGRANQGKACLREAERRMGETPTQFAGHEPGGGGPALDATTALAEARSILSRMQQYGEAATAAAAESATLCDLSRSEANRAGAAVDRLAAMVKAMATPPGGVGITRKLLSDRMAQWLAEADLRQAEAAEAAKGILDARRQLEVHVGNVCRNAKGLSGLSRAKLQVRYDTAQSALEATQRAVSKSREQYGLLHNTVAEAEALLNEAEAATGAAVPSDNIKQARTAARMAKQAIEKTKQLRDRVWSQFNELDRLQNHASDLPRQAWQVLEPHREGKDGKEAKALYVRIEKALNALADEKVAAEACLEEADEKTAALETRTADLTGQMDKIAGRAAATGGGGDLGTLRQRADDVRTTAAAAEGFAQAAEGQGNQADFCLGEIRTALSKPAETDPAVALADEAIAIVNQDQEKERRQQARRTPRGSGDTLDYGSYVRETEGVMGASAWCSRRDPNARFVEQSGRSDCVCGNGMRWNDTETECVSNRKYDYAQAAQQCPRDFHDSVPIWEPGKGRHSCGCPSPLTWNRDRTACVMPPPEPRVGGHEGEPGWSDLPNQPQGDSYTQAQNECNAMGAVPRFDSATNRYDCECPRGTYVHNGVCISEAEAVETKCQQQMRGSQASRSSTGYVCRCPSGSEPNRSGTACVTEERSPQIADTPKCPKPLVWDWIDQECFNPSDGGLATGPESCRSGEVWGYGTCIKESELNEEIKELELYAPERNGGGAGAKPPGARSAHSQKQIKGWLERLNCLLEGRRRYPRVDNDCRGHITMTSRSAGIANLREKLRAAGVSPP